LPFIQINGDSAVEDSQVGDLTLIGKYAFLNNPNTGNVLCGGLAITVPTGDSFVTPTGEKVHATFLQPFLGYVFNFTDSLYFHGFSSLAVATETNDVTVLFNDIGVGYWLYRRGEDRLFQALVPTFELHVNTPLNHRGVSGFSSDPVGFPDIVDVTGGVYFMFRGGSSLGVAIATPLT